MRGQGVVGERAVFMACDFYPSDDAYLACVYDLIHHPLVLSMAQYIQHGNTDCLRHSIHVSYRSYVICKRRGYDHVSAARGGLLHDFFLYDWHDEQAPCGGLHGLVHPRIALQNAKKQFALNEREQDIIQKHMWPLTIRPPRFIESFIVLAVDKYCALAEMVSKEAEAAPLSP